MGLLYSPDFIRQSVEMPGVHKPSILTHSVKTPSVGTHIVWTPNVVNLVWGKLVLGHLLL